MRDTPLQHILKKCVARVIESGDDGFAVQVNSLRVIASWGLGWEHASVSHPYRCPTWDEMSYVKGLLWQDTEWVVQFHPPESEYVNNHKTCLHMWRSTATEQPTPPSWMVGVRKGETLEQVHAAAEAAYAKGTP